MKSFAEIKEHLMKNKKFADEYKRRETLAKFIDDILILRGKRGMSQKDLAEKIGTKVPNISRIESGHQNISFSMMQKLSEALDGNLLVTLRGEDFVELSEEAKKILKLLVDSEKKEPAEILEEALNSYHQSYPVKIIPIPTKESFHASSYSPNEGEGYRFAS